MKRLLILTLSIITLFVCVFTSKTMALENDNISLQETVEQSELNLTEQESLTAIPQPNADSIVPELEPEKQSLSKEMLGYVRAYTSEIFCSLTFIGSLITAFLYKKGLLPTLSDGINKIYSVILKSNEKATDIQNRNSETLNDFLKNIPPLLEKAAALTEYAESLRENSLTMQSEIEKERAEREALSKVLTGQTELLYGVFMSANIPEYQKEQLAEKYNSIQTILKLSAKTNENAEQ